MFRKKMDHADWVNERNASKNRLRNTLQQSLGEIHSKMQACNVYGIGVYFPTEKTLSPSFQDFMIIVFHDNPISQASHTQSFKDYLQNKLFSENFHCWVGSEQELLQCSARLKTNGYFYQGNFFKDIFLKDLQTLDKFLMVDKPSLAMSSSQTKKLTQMSV